MKFMNIWVIPLAVALASCGGGGGGSSPSAVETLAADAGSDQAVTRYQTVSLDGSASANATSYAWKQVSGAYAELSEPNASQTEFVAPSAGVYAFELTVGDGTDSDTDEVTVTVAELPSIVLTSPVATDAWVTTDSILNLAGEVSRNVVSVVARLEGGQAEYAASIDANGQFTVNAIPLPVGDSSIALQAKDANGASAQQSLQVTRNESAIFASFLEVSTDEAQVGETVDVVARVSLVPSSVSGVVELVAVDAAGNVDTVLTELLDNGHSDNQDEYREDGVYSGTAVLDTSGAGEHRWRVRVSGASDDFSDTRLLMVKATVPVVSFTQAQTLSASVIDGSGIQEGALLSTSELEAHKNQLLADYLARDEVLDALLSADRSALNVYFKSGVNQVIFFREREAESVAAASSPQASFTASVSSVGSLDSAYLSPYHNDWVVSRLQQTYTAYQALLSDANYAFTDVQTLLDEQVTVDELKSLEKAGVYFINTHGGVYQYRNGERSTVLATREEVTDALIDQYMDDLLAERVLIGNVHTYVWHADTNQWEYEETANGVFLVGSRFFERYLPWLPDSLVFVEACHGLDDGLALANTFLAEGARAVVGYEDEVYVGYAESTINTMLTRLRAGDSLSDAITFASNTHGQTDSDWYFTQFGEVEENPTPSRVRLVGDESAEELVLEKSYLVNPSFEDDDRGWYDTYQGAQMVFAGFAGEESVDGNSMMVAATIGGTYAGFTQQVRIPAGSQTLSLSYNLIREITREAGVDPATAPWRDQAFYVAIQPDGGVETQLFAISGQGSGGQWVNMGDDRKCIRINERLYETKPDAPLCSAYKTGWLEADLDISTHAGKRVTLKLMAKDSTLSATRLSEVQDVYALVDKVSIQ